MEKRKANMTASFKKRVGELLFNYSQTSTIAGFHYIFEPKLPAGGKAFWLVLVVLLTAVGTYLSFQYYIQWKSEPVVITLTSTGLPISKIDFPSGVNFTNILLAAFLYKSFARCFFVPTF